MLVTHFVDVFFVPLLLCGVLVQCVGNVAASDYSHSLYGKMYRIAVGDDTKSGDAARTQCRDGGGTLVDIRSDEEVAHLVDVIEAAGGAPALGRSYLVGGVYKRSFFDVSKMMWYYENDNVMTYSNWASDQPAENVNRACIIMKPASDRKAKWHTVDCGGGGPSGYHYICAKEEGPFKYGFYGKRYHVPDRNDLVTGVLRFRNKCRNLGGVLADIHSSEELQHVKRVIYSLDTHQNRVSTYWFAIGGQKVNGSWMYEDGTSMTYTNWMSGEGEADGCALLNPDTSSDLKDKRTVTAMSALNYFVKPCDTVRANYVCSKEETGRYMFIAGDYVEGSRARRKCESYPAGKYLLEFVIRTVDGSPVESSARKTWARKGTSANGMFYQNYLRETITTLPYTGVTMSKIEANDVTHRGENGLLIYCQKRARVNTVSVAHTLTVAFLPSQTVMSETNDMIEGKIHVITVTVLESFPKPQVAVDFRPKNAPVNIHTQNNKTGNYSGFITVSTITFVPDRSDNGKSITTRATNDRFPEKSVVKRQQIQVAFKPKSVAISNFENMIEDIPVHIKISCGESMPNSTIRIDFLPKQNDSVNMGKTEQIVGVNNGFKSVFTYTFTPSREDNGKVFTAHVVNAKFPHLCLKLEKIAVVYFAHSTSEDGRREDGVTKSLTSPEKEGGINTAHIIAFLVGLFVGLLCTVVALVVYIKLRGVTMCPSGGTSQLRVIVDDRRPALEAPKQRGATVLDGIPPLPCNAARQQPIVCEYGDGLDVPQREAIVNTPGNGTPRAAVRDMPSSETSGTYDTSAQLALHEPYDTVQERRSRYTDSVELTNTADVDAYDIAVDDRL